MLIATVATTPPIDPDVHRRIRLRRIGVQGALASVIAQLAFGEPQDAVVIVAKSSSAEVRQ